MIVRPAAGPVAPLNGVPAVESVGANDLLEPPKIIAEIDLKQPRPRSIICSRLFVRVFQFDATGQQPEDLTAEDLAELFGGAS